MLTFVCTCYFIYLNIDHSSLEALDSISTILHNEQEPKTGVDKLQNINVNSVVNNNILKPPIESVKGTENQQINADEKNNIVEDRQQLQDSYIKGCTYGNPIGQSKRFYIQDHSVHLVPPPLGNVDLVCCDTTKGHITIAVHPTWAPKGAARFLDMVISGFFNTKVGLFRSLNHFLVQFGLHGEPSVQKTWNRKGSIKDDPSWLPFGPSWRVHPNNTALYRYQKGYMAYAGGGKNSRGTQLILAYDRNKMLGGGSPWEVPFGQLIGQESYEHIKQFYTNYGEQVSQGKLQNRGNKYLEEFPELDYIFNCNVIQEDVEWRPIG